MKFQTVETIKIFPAKQGVLVLLGAATLEKVLPITIGQEEALAITRPLEQVSTPRPLTHDLLKNILDTLAYPLVKVEVYDFIADIFYARLLLKKDAEEIQIDSRPSDAIALALRFAVPIFVSEDLVKKSGVEMSELEEGLSDFQSVEGLYADFPKASVQSVEGLNKDELSKDLESLLDEAVRKEDYEMAARLRDRIRSGKDKS